MGLFTETVSFSDAAAMLDACRAELEKSGFQSQADQLRGVEVFDADAAEVALFILRSLPPTNEECEMGKKYAAKYLIHVIQASRQPPRKTG